MGTGANENGRILWLGDRPNSVGDEPSRLRRMGFQVTEIAEDIWGRYVKGGVPADVAEHLCRLDVRRPQISRECGDLLNRSYETIVVSNSAIWTNEILRVYDRRLIVRAHGWESPLGSELFHLGSWPIVARRSNIHHVIAHAHLAQNDLPVGAVAPAPAWFHEALHRFKDTWRGPLGGALGLIVVSLPADERSAASKRQRSFVRRHFATSDYDHNAHLGLRDEDDWRRQRQRFQRLQYASGYLYTSLDKCQLHMAPMEMMLVGGPVVYFAAGPLNHLMPAGAPGCAETIDDANELCRRLRLGDRRLISEILASQEGVRASYHVDRAGPAFDEVFSRILGEPEVNRPGISRSGIAYESELPARQIRQLIGALAYSAGAEEPEGGLSAEGAVGVFYRIVLGIDPDPKIAASHAEALQRNMPPMQVFKAILDEYRLPTNEQRATLLSSFGLDPAQLQPSRLPSVRLRHHA